MTPTRSRFEPRCRGRRAGSRRSTVVEVASEPARSRPRVRASRLRRRRRTPEAAEPRRASCRTQSRRDESLREAMARPNRAEDGELVENDDLIFAAEHVESDTLEETSEPVVELEPLSRARRGRPSRSAAVVVRRCRAHEAVVRQERQVEPAEEAPRRRQSSQRPQDRRSQDRRLPARRRSRSGERRPARAARARPHAARAGHRRRRRGPRRGRARQRPAQASSTSRSCRTRTSASALASNRIGVRTFEIAGIDDEARFDNAVRFKAHEVLPVAGQRVRARLPRARGADRRRPASRSAGSCSSSPLATRSSRTSTSRSGPVIKLAGIDLEALGLLRAFVEPRRRAHGADDTSTVVVSIGHESSTLLVCRWRRLRVHARLRLGWRNAPGGDRAGARRAPGRGRDDPPPPLAVRARPSVRGARRGRANRAIEAVRLRLTPFARELVSSLQFYQTQPDSLGIGEIVITGGTSQLEGLGDALHQMIGVQVRVGDPLAAADRPQGRRVRLRGVDRLAGGSDRSRDRRRPDPRRQPAAARHRQPAPQALNLAADRDSRRSRRAARRSSASCSSQAHGKVTDWQIAARRRSRRRSPRCRSRRCRRSTPRLQGAEAAARNRRRAGARRPRSPGTRVLRDLSRVLPANVWLTALQAACQPRSAPRSRRRRRPVGREHHGLDPGRSGGADRRDRSRLHVLAARRRTPARPPRDPPVAQPASRCTASRGQRSATRTVVHFTIARRPERTGGAA